MSIKLFPIFIFPFDSRMGRINQLCIQLWKLGCNKIKTPYNDEFVIPFQPPVRLQLNTQRQLPSQKGFSDAPLPEFVLHSKSTWSEEFPNQQPKAATIIINHI